MVDPLQFHCYRLVGTFHSKNGVKFFLHDVKKRMVTLFGSFFFISYTDISIENTNMVGGL